MPYGKRYARRRRARRPRRSYRRKSKSRALARTRVGRVPRGLRPSVYYFKRTLHQVQDLSSHSYSSLPAGWIQDPSANAGQNHSWTVDMGVSLSMVNDSSDFANLFESYKLVGCKETLFLTSDPPQQQNPIQPALPSGYYRAVPIMQKQWREQFIPAGAITRTQAEDIQRGKRRMLKLTNKPTYHRLMQAAPVTLDGSTSASGMQLCPVKPRWIPTVVNSTIHYGGRAIIYALTDTGSMPPVTVRRELTIYIACRGVK